MGVQLLVLFSAVLGLALCVEESKYSVAFSDEM